MYNYDYAEDYDYAYESFRDETGHITNFDAHQEPIYQKSIDEYKKVDPSAEMWIGDSYKWAGMKGFYAACYGNSGAGLGPFWRIFDKIKEESKE